MKDAWDMMGKKCKRCKKGTYQETGFHDDMDGVVHCTACGAGTVRQPGDSPKEKKVVKEYLTFKDFLRILDEDTEGDIASLMADISMIDSTMATRNTPMIRRKVDLQKRLAMLQKKSENEKQNKPDSESGQKGNETSTPGSTGASTPGSQ